mmetsp:Transcript_5423/g.12419  ORF Transcript_5423/g.12419 Transcript_5423/m.12419 type:complete len:204 (+) Transcript_5423:135-746(+)
MAGLTAGLTLCKLAAAVALCVSASACREKSSRRLSSPGQTTSSRLRAGRVSSFLGLLLLPGSSSPDFSIGMMASVFHCSMPSFLALRVGTVCSSSLYVCAPACATPCAPNIPAREVDGSLIVIVFRDISIGSRGRGAYLDPALVRGDRPILEREVDLAVGGSATWAREFHHCLLPRVRHWPINMMPDGWCRRVRTAKRGPLGL